MNIPKPRPVVKRGVNRRSIDVSTPTRANRIIRRLSIPPEKTVSELAERIPFLKAISHESKTLPYPEVEYHLRIRMFGNWGDPNYITCSSIDILDKQMVPIRIAEIIPEKNCCLAYSSEYCDTELPLEANMRLLSNGNIMKKGDTHSWACKFPPNSRVEEVWVKFIVFSRYPPESMRIWNSEAYGKSNLRYYDVYNGNQKLFSGEVPMDFGVIFSLVIENKYILPAIAYNFDDGPQVQRLEDKYGELPYTLTKTIEFEFVSSYNPENTHFALNSIQIFNSFGEIIRTKDIKSFNVLNGASLSSPVNLFKSKQRTTDLVDMWIAQNHSNDNIRVKFMLEKPQLITLIRVWNCNAMGEFRHYGVKNMKVYLNGRMSWKGRIEEAYGMSGAIEDSVKDIWFTNLPDIRSNPELAEIITSRSLSE